ncbi:MAG: hypothetical protein KIT16_07685 [Rhodospirillaceae bacterium]|nr:hypothetical protein [Rhodospirillaceae bacterium]
MRDTIWRALALLGFVTGTLALAGVVVLWLRLDSEGGTPAPKAEAAVTKLEGRTALLSRLIAERRAVARIRLHFLAGGALEASCLLEAAEGGQSACFADVAATGKWMLRGAQLCLVAAALDLAAESCYALSGSGEQWTLVGPGLLAGAMQLR